MNMLKRLFSFSNATLFVALALSTVAAWYSIIGLTAIFAGAVIPIIIMGSVLEVAKVTTTVWLRKYWSYSSWMLKIYLVPAVMALALMTSMGIFGFLSKAHMDQGIGTGDVAAKVALFDEKIKIQRDNITANRAMLAQMDTQVNDIMSKGDSERAVERSVTIRKQQANERNKLLKDIELSNTNIQKLNEERAPIASELRTAEAEVGPIKYIAAFIYGDNPDANLLERAVRWVIVLLVVVFDPLAILLVIGANQSKEWDKRIEEEENKKLLPVYQPNIDPIEEKEDPYVPDVAEKPTIEETAPEPINCNMCGTVLENAPGIGLFCPNKECDVLDGPFDGSEPVELVIHWPEVPTKVEEPVVEEPIITVKQGDPEAVGFLKQHTLSIREHVEESTETKEKDDTPNFEGFKDLTTGEWIQTGPAFATVEEPVVDNIDTSHPYTALGDGYVEYEGKRMHKRVLADMRPDLGIEVDDPTEPGVTFGENFPKHPKLGDMFTRVDVMPHRLFKFNGKKWIEVSREKTDSHLSEDAYIQHLIEKIANGEYDPDHLTPSEQDAIAQYIKNNQPAG